MVHNQTFLFDVLSIVSCNFDIILTVGFQLMKQLLTLAMNYEMFQALNLVMEIKYATHFVAM